MRTLLAAMVVIVGVMLLASCGVTESEEEDAAGTTATSAAAGASETGTPGATTSPTATASPTATPSPAPTASPTASPSPSPEVTVAGPMTCVFPQDTTSFHLTMSVELSSEDYGDYLATLGRRGGRGSLPDWFDYFPGNVTMEYAYVAPDRYSVVVSQEGEETCSYVVIGSQVWCKAARSTHWEEQPASDEYFFFSTQDLCEYVEDLLPSPGQQGEKETVNGIQTVHYQISDETSAMDWLLDGVSSGYTYDLWLAENGNWPVRVEFEAYCQPTLLERHTLNMDWEISDLNDPSITVEPPTTS